MRDAAAQSPARRPPAFVRFARAQAPLRVLSTQGGEVSTTSSARSMLHQDQLQNKSTQHESRTEDCIVFAVLEIQFAGKSPGFTRMLLRIRSPTRQQPWHSRGIFGIFRKPGHQICLFRPNHWNIDEDKHQHSSQRDPRISRSDQKSRGNKQRAKVKRIARVSVWSCGCYSHIFANVSGGRSAHCDAGNNQHRSPGNPDPSGPREPEIGSSKYEPKRHPYAGCDPRPVRHAHSPAGTVRRRSPRPR